MKVIGNTPNPQASNETNAERITTGVLVGREPHEPTFSRNGKELWVTVRGENHIAVLDTATAIRGSRGIASRAVRLYVDCLNGPAQVWFSADGRLGFVASQKASQLEVIETNFGRDGFSRPKRRGLIDIKAQDPFAFTPFQEELPPMVKSFGFRTSWRTPFQCGRSMQNRKRSILCPWGSWPGRIISSSWKMVGGGPVVSLARVDDGGPGGVAASQIAIIDRSAASGSR